MNYAYTPVLSRNGFTIGVAERDQPGYWPRPNYGTFTDRDSAQARADALNRANGVSDRDAALIVASSMREQNRRAR